MYALTCRDDADVLLQSLLQIAAKAPYSREIGEDFGLAVYVATSRTGLRQYVIVTGESSSPGHGTARMPHTRLLHNCDFRHEQAASCITMVRRVGTGRQQIDATRGLHVAVALFEFSTRKPPLAAICLPHVIRSIRHYQLMRRVASRAWPQELNNLNLDLEE